MTNYKVTNFNERTPGARQTKLESNLKEIDGVETVKLNPTKGQISLAFRSAKEPKKEVIQAAVSKAGFTLVSAQS